MTRHKKGAEQGCVLCWCVVEERERKRERERERERE